MQVGWRLAAGLQRCRARGEGGLATTQLAMQKVQPAAPRDGPFCAVTIRTLAALECPAEITRAQGDLSTCSEHERLAHSECRGSHRCAAGEGLATGT